MNRQQCLVSGTILQGNPNVRPFVGYIVDNFDRSIKILEIGAGQYSTDILSRRFKHVYSIENDGKWMLYKNRDNLTYFKVPLDDRLGWYVPQLFDNVLRIVLPKVDLVILDGPVGGYNVENMIQAQHKPFRYGFVMNFVSPWVLHTIKTKQSFSVIIDDTHRPWKEQEVVKFFQTHKNFDVKDFTSFCVAEFKKV